MRIVLLSTSDLSGGGAYIAAYRLHKEFRCQGKNSMMLVQTKVSKDPHVYSPDSALHRLVVNIIPILDQLPTRLLRTSNTILHSPSWVPERTVDYLKNLNPDLVNLHWINWGFLKPESLTKINVPIVWTLHDMWAFCGAEHHTDNLRYIEGYKNDNRPAQEFGFDLNRWVWERKVKAWKNLTNLTIVAPSNWLADCAIKSLLFKDKKVVVIPNGVDITVFAPRDKILSRKKLNLSLNKKIILFGAQSGNMPWKGPDLLIRILKKLIEKEKDNNFLLAMYGRGDKDYLIDKSGLNPDLFIHLGFFGEEKKLSYLYSAADLLLVTSRRENLPNSIMESMSCGTPAIAFDIGGVSDLIDNNINGYLVKPYDIDAYTNFISKYFHNSDMRKRMSSLARRKIVDKFSIKKVAKKYLHLYNSLLK